MSGWASESYAIANLVVSILMLAVWGVYLELFWRSYRRRLRPKLVISRGAGSGIGAYCLISNLSSEPVFIEGIIIRLLAAGERTSIAITDLAKFKMTGPKQQEPSPGEGPMKPGDYMVIGRFSALVDAASAAADRELRSPWVAEIWVIADYSCDGRVIYSRRRFTVRTERDERVLAPERLETEIVRSRSEQEEITQLLLENTDGSRV